MSIASEIKRITEARNAIATHLNRSWGITGVSTLEQIKNTITGIGPGQNVTIKVGTSSVSIPKGYYNGNQKIEVQDSGGGTFELITHTATITTQEQTLLPGNVILGADGFSSVTIPPVSSYLTGKVTATAANVLSGKNFVDKDGNQVGGTMPNNGKVTKTLTTDSNSYTVPKGYHDGTGTVSVAGDFIGSDITQYDSEDGNIVLSPSNTSQVIAGGYYVPNGNSVSVLVDSDPIKTITPSKATQPVSGADDEGNAAFITSVTVKPIPDKYQDISGVTATADKVLTGSSFVNSSGVLTNGTIPNIGNVSVVLTNTNKYYDIPEGYHAGGSRVGVAGDFIGSDITRQAAKTITPIKSAQTAVAANVYTTGAITVGAIPSKYQDITVLEDNLDGIAENISFIGSDDRTKYGTAQLRSGAFEWDYRTSNTFTIPTGIYRDGESGTTSSMSWYENETSFQTWVEADRSTLPATDDDGGTFSRAYIVPCEGNGYITRMNGPYGIDTSVGGGDKYGVLFYNNTFYVVDKGGPNTGNERLFTHGYSYTISTAYVTFNALESALAAI